MTEVGRFVPRRTTSRGFAAGRIPVAVLVCLIAALTSGCVERRMTIRSNPSNALVILDGQEIGFTPVSVPFTYYGERQIKLVKDGYETKTINQTISTPWYEFLGVDFISEVLVPCRIRDERNYLYTLEPALMTSNDQLLQRAAQVREQGKNPPPDVLRRAGVPEAGSPLSIPAGPPGPPPGAAPVIPPAAGPPVGPPVASPIPPTAP